MAFLGFGKKDEEKKETKKTDQKDQTDKDIEKKSPTASKKGTKNKKTTSPKKKERKKESVAPRISENFNPGDIILGPRITEKGAVLAEDENAYTFNVSKNANKIQIKRAIEEIYKVSPVKINTIRIPDKTVIRRGLRGRKSGGKKAVVYLKEGDKIEFV